MISLCNFETFILFTSSLHVGLPSGNSETFCDTASKTRLTTLVFVCRGSTTERKKPAIKKASREASFSRTTVVLHGWEVIVGCPGNGGSTPPKSPCSHLHTTIKTLLHFIDVRVIPELNFSKHLEEKLDLAVRMTAGTCIGGAMIKGQQWCCIRAKKPSLSIYSKHAMLAFGVATAG